MSHSIQPVDLPLVRDSAVRFVESESAGIYQTYIEQGRQHNYPMNMTPREAGEYMARMERSRLRLSELYYVTANMMALAGTAAKSLPEVNLAPEDLPSPAGLMVFEAPLRSIHNEEDPLTGEVVGISVDIIAVTWGPFPNSPIPGVWVTYWSDGHKVLADRVAAYVEAGKVTPEQVRTARAQLSPLLIDNEAQMFFGEAGVTREEMYEQFRRMSMQSEEDARESVREVLTLQTIWMLLQQPALVKDTTLELPRATRRRYKRLNIPASPVRVISLRHAVGPNDGSGEGRDYHHQWVVRGHWRRQWHASRQEHRPIWIAPHIKGPEGAPLLGGEKVYALRK